jgi:hypothetical protein
MRSVSLVVLLAAACGSPAVTAAPPSAEPAVATDAAAGWFVGTVAVVGSLPVDARTVVSPPGRAELTVRGPLEREIRALSGAEVAVYGRARGRTLEAAAYEVRSVDGAPVITGTVEEAPGGGLQLRTAGGSVLQLRGGGQGLRAGQKVWVQGPGAVEIRSYGVISP